MFFDLYGEAQAPTLILLHGAAALDTFAHQYESLARHFRVLVPHLPGAGEAAAAAYEPQATADALAAWIASLNAGKVLLMGHSVGAELAVKLVSEQESLFSRAVFLSPWLTASETSARLYSGLARMSYGAIKSEKLLRMQAKYWGYTPEQTERLVSYSPRISQDTYVSFYSKRVRLKDLAGYGGIQIPMLAMCARGETAETRSSVRALGEQNTNCLTAIFPKGSHDFVLRCSGLLNPLLLDFLRQE
ncbi:putative aminoacrylate hydrolase RutD [bioreactor metagenome]|uniref:Putative aminoacrylate hydrolase RutD n=1 Tax=bioreactor metagenome TaxID=1076179 RepID=A0A645B2L5_9ZZZZ|nr:alpha/beta hydrolase [Christensenella sp.]